MRAWSVGDTAETEAGLAKPNVDCSVKIVSVQVDFSKNRRKFMKYQAWQIEKKHFEICCKHN